MVVQKNTRLLFPPMCSSMTTIAKPSKHKVLLQSRGGHKENHWWLWSICHSSLRDLSSQRDISQLSLLLLSGGHVGTWMLYWSSVHIAGISYGHLNPVFDMEPCQLSSFCHAHDGSRLAIELCLHARCCCWLYCLSAMTNDPDSCMTAYPICDSSTLRCICFLHFMTLNHPLCLS